MKWVFFIASIGAACACGSADFANAGPNTGKKFGNVRADVVACETLDSLTIAGAMSNVTSIPKDCRVLPKGAWYGVALVDLSGATPAVMQLAVPLADGSFAKLWVSAGQIFGVTPR